MGVKRRRDATMQVNGAIHLDQPARLKLSEQIAQQILGQIADGTLRPGDRLPTENQLLEQQGAAPVDWKLP